MSRRISSGARYGLGEQLTEDLLDYCSAHHNAPASEVIREAVATFLRERLKDRDLRLRFEAARKKRLGISASNKIATLRPRPK